MNQVDRAVLKTICYADVFDYPLLADEMERYLISGKKVSGKRVATSLDALVAKQLLEKRDDYYFLKGRAKLVKLRTKRAVWSARKIQRAEEVAEQLKSIGGVAGVFLTGAVAMENAEREDDIDLMIVTRAGGLWQTRYQVVRLLRGQGVMRRAGDVAVKDLICTNMYVDEEHLSVPKHKRNLYTAHEVVQVKPLIDTQEVYGRFLQANEWAGKYLANFALPTKIKNVAVSPTTAMNRYIEQVAYWLQYGYMKPKMTSETVSRHVAMFHPRDTASWVEERYNKRLKQMKVMD